MLRQALCLLTQLGDANAHSLRRGGRLSVLLARGRGRRLLRLGIALAPPPA